MSERKVLNKYYPPDFDPSKIPRMKLAKNRQYTVRLMAPFNMRCITCGEYIYKGKKFNARKEDVEHETYLGIRIYRFYIKCTRCLQEISFKTDPQNTDYEIEAGATRNFMALKLAEEQALREEQEAREEEANNPMKLLENRTQQSRNEIELLESLEELRDLNRRQHSVDYEAMLQQYNPAETERERLERQEREDEEYVKSVFRKPERKAGATITEEIIEELPQERPALPANKTLKDATTTTTATATAAEPSAAAKLLKLADGKATFAAPQRPPLGSKSLANLVKRKQPLVLVKPRQQPNETTSNSSTTTTTSPAAPPTASIATAGGNRPGGLSLLSAYSDSSDGDDEDN